MYPAGSAHNIGSPPQSRAAYSLLLNPCNWKLHGTDLGISAYKDCALWQEQTPLQLQPRALGAVPAMGETSSRAAEGGSHPAHRNGKEQQHPLLVSDSRMGSPGGLGGGTPISRCCLAQACNTVLGNDLVPSVRCFQHSCFLFQEIATQKNKKAKQDLKR
uniref:Uncharacterized protein n=1 Tax=Varanus komodoensis TaxID=61221 RepID=A0A8D2L1E3_VARKO